MRSRPGTVCETVTAEHEMRITVVWERHLQTSYDFLCGTVEPVAVTVMTFRIVSRDRQVPSIRIEIVNLSSSGNSLERNQ